MQVALWRGLPCQSDSSNPFPLAFSTLPPPLCTPLSSPSSVALWVRLHYPLLPWVCRTVPSPLLFWVRLFLLCCLHLLWVCFPLLHNPLSFSCGYASSCSVTPYHVSTLPYAPVGTLPSAPSPPSAVDTLPSAPSPPSSAVYASLCSLEYASLCLSPHKATPDVGP